jgi:hypothetical protein
MADAARAARCADNRAQIARYLNFSHYWVSLQDDRWHPNALSGHLRNHMLGILFPGPAPRDPLVLASFDRFLRSAKFISEGSIIREMKILHAKTYDAFGMADGEFAAHLLANYP